MQRTIDYIVASVHENMLAILMNPVCFNVGMKKKKKKTKLNHYTDEYIQCDITIAMVFEWPINIAYFTKH